MCEHLRTVDLVERFGVLENIMNNIGVLAYSMWELTQQHSMLKVIEYGGFECCGNLKYI